MLQSWRWLGDTSIYQLEEPSRQTEGERSYTDGDRREAVSGFWIKDVGDQQFWKGWCFWGSHVRSLAADRWGAATLSERSRQRKTATEATKFSGPNRYIQTHGISTTQELLRQLRQLRRARWGRCPQGKPRVIGAWVEAARLTNWIWRKWKKSRVRLPEKSDLTN